MKHKMPAKFKMGEICGRFDISRATLYRWENDGLLTGVKRDWRGWRVYTDFNLKDIQKLMKCKGATE